MEDILQSFDFIDNTYRKYIKKLELKYNENTFNMFLLDLMLFYYKDKLEANSINLKDVSLSKTFVGDEEWLNKVFKKEGIKRALQLSLVLNEIPLPTLSFTIYDKENYFGLEFRGALKRFIIHFNL